MRKPKKDKGADAAQDFAGMPASTTIMAADIQQKEFGVSRFGGYRMRDVDEFLDLVTESMTKLSDENQRLRSAKGLPAVAPVVDPALSPPLHPQPARAASSPTDPIRDRKLDWENFIDVHLHAASIGSEAKSKCTKQKCSEYTDIRMVALRFRI